jgi:hypothetical protein
MKHYMRAGGLVLLMAMPAFDAARAEEDCTGSEAKVCRDSVMAQIKASRYSTKTGGFLPQGFTTRSGVTLVSTMTLQKTLPACRAMIREKAGKLLREPNTFGFCIELAPGGKIGRIVEIE